MNIDLSCNIFKTVTIKRQNSEIQEKIFFSNKKKH